MAGLGCLRDVARRLSPRSLGGQRCALRPATATLPAFAGAEWWTTTAAAPGSRGSQALRGGSRVAGRSAAATGAGSVHRRGIHATAASNAAAKRDYYEVLGIAKGADEKEIKKACVASPAPAFGRPAQL